jgi:phage terminase small subunit
VGLFKKLHQMDVERNAKHPEVAAYFKDRQEKLNERNLKARSELKSNLAVTTGEITKYKIKREQEKPNTALETLNSSISKDVDKTSADNPVSGWVIFKQKNHENVEKREAEANAIKRARGNELGYVKIGYVGGFDNQKRTSAKLIFYEHRIEYSLYGQIQKDLVIDGNDVIGIEIGGQQQTNSRISVTRMATLGVFSLAAPKRSTVKYAAVVISLKDGRQIYFQTQYLTEFEVHSKLANAISYYSQQQAKGQQDNNAQGINDAATEIMKYATLRKRGVITEDEFQAKKKQLLGL